MKIEITCKKTSRNPDGWTARALLDRRHVLVKGTGSTDVDARLALRRVFEKRAMETRAILEAIDQGAAS